MRSPKIPPGPGYSGTPLAKKLGMAEAFEVLAVGAPPEYRQWLEPLPPGWNSVCNR